ncbi:hypothetical protein FGG08_007468 [Glutinoglossum americanum]|uniref:Uncharacterized protein n=1 Tax=Glutinoglossum americanum TaxID=1670608 RepID=A0A9P8HYS1_9PEZI|nr:hypothetical protein FGG08_007468 [Glutinoglossum americanum]
MASMIVPQDTGPFESSIEEPVSLSQSWETPRHSFTLEGENWLTRTKSDPTGVSSNRYLDLVPLSADRNSSVSVSIPGSLDKSRLSPTARSRSAPKIPPNLQLPSFDSLGIAVPHPDRPRLRGQLAKGVYDRSMLAANNSHSPARDGSRNGFSRFDISSSGLSAFGGEQYQQGRVGCSSLLTPPDENGAVVWGMSPRSFNGTAASSPSTDPDHESKHMKPLLASTATSDSGMDSSGPDNAPFVSSNATERKNDGSRANSYGSRTLHDDGSSEGRLNSAVEVLLAKSLPCSTITEAVRILSYTLPCPPCFEAVGSPSTLASCSGRPQTLNRTDPINSGELASPISTASTIIIDAVQEKFNQRGKRAYIHINYAVLPTFDLGNLPTTPPLTGPSYHQGITPSPGYFGRSGIELGTAYRTTGPSGGSPGYFGSSLFSSVVLATQTTHPSYQGPKSLDGDFGRINSSPMRRLVPLPSPNPILPPSSQHMSLLERYIPPASPSDDQYMFSPTSSILFDRLFELSPNGGSLIFIYPTRTGAREFCRHYLGPVIEPLLRRLMVLHQLPPHLLTSIQRMTAVEDMMEFEGLHEKLQAICANINAEDAGEGPMGEVSSDEEEIRAAIRKAGVQIVYASRQKVRLDPRVWPEWWAQQEASRVRQLVRRHFASVSMPPPTNPITLNLPSTFPSSAPTSVSSPSHGVFMEGDDPADDRRTSVNSPSQLLSYTNSSPGDLSREVLEGVRASGSPTPGRGLGEVVADNLLRSSGLGGVGISMGTTGLSHGRVSAASVATHVREGVEVGVFVLRRAR